MNRSQITIFSILFIIITTILTIIYFIFLRPTFVVLYENVRDTDTAKIVAELDKQNVEYKLEDNGRRILVSEGEADKARVLIAGSGIAMGGVVGFELFNETDMGLTEFAQKVNYQRALQGELARTIMTMEGIDFARVHLSLPERVLFRANQQGPKAAVTIQTTPGRPLSANRITGIQQLISSAVTDLPASQVAVLDDRGGLLNSIQENAAAKSWEPSENDALEGYYRARAKSAVERAIPGLPFQIRVLAIGTVATSTPATSSTEPAKTDTAENLKRRTTSIERNFSLRITLRTQADLNEEDREILHNAITQATDLSREGGDILRFETGPVEQFDQPDLHPVNEARESSTSPISNSPSQQPTLENISAATMGSRWFWAAVALLAVMGLILIRRRSKMSEDEHRSFAEMLNESISVKEGLPDGR